MKKCTRCGEEKILDEYHCRKASKKDGLQSKCKDCQRTETKSFYEKNPNYKRIWRGRDQEAKNRTRNENLKSKYGITIEDYNHLFSEQDGKCAICHDHQSLINKTLVVDHDHHTGEVRGLLCGPCNRGIGQFRERLDLIDQAAIYLRRSRIRLVENK